MIHDTCKHAIITLLTDFGTTDEYVGIMKGVILSINPCAKIVDITHHIDPQDLIQAAYSIKSSYKYFPEGTVHINVVDPGVGSGRGILALEAMGHIFLGPDNGILTLLLEDENISSIIRVENTSYFLNSVSRTFHGRDIFAPVGAHISMGLGIGKLGTPIDKKESVSLSIQKPHISGEGDLVGTIVRIDRFGNLITNIDLTTLKKLCIQDLKKKVGVKIGDHIISGVSKNYESASSQTPLAIIGSFDYLEIAVNCGNAGTYFMAKKGDAVKVIR